MMIEDYQPTFPYFGGKSRAASLIWYGLGDCKNYVEPFFGSGAVLFGRPHEPRTETVNDLDGFVANFWRAVKSDPEAVADAADWPVNEHDISARHYWLVTEGRKRLTALMLDPEAFDAKIAGWWVWGACAWIGSGWCSGSGPWVAGEGGWELRNAGQGVNRQMPHLGNAGQGVNRQMPHLGDAGQGVNRQMPHLGNAGQGVNRQMPHLGDAGKGHHHRNHLVRYFQTIADRLRYVRVCCGDWRRVLTPSVTFRHGMTGILLDPPYGEGKVDYQAGGNKCDTISSEVREWAIENGCNPQLRIVLCGYESQHEMPDDWRVEEWKTAGGYSSTAAQHTDAKDNCRRERLWFSPACLNTTPSLFGEMK